MVDKIISFDIPGIMSCQQNRFPMLFIDKITECVPLKYAKGYKLFSYNEWYFHGYETSSPKVWNVIQVEAMSQAFLMTFLSSENSKGKVAMSNKFNKVQFLRKIEPGDKLELEATLDSYRHGIAKGSVIGYVDGEKACSMDCIIIVPDFFEKFQHALPQIDIDRTSYNQSIKEFESFKENNFELYNTDFGIEKIRECLLNKYPWLFLDKVKGICPGKSVRVIKNFTYNEHFFPAHFPDDPSVPGFLQIETCMQAFLLTFLSLDDYKKRETADRSLMNVQLKRKIIPGETLEIFAFLDRFSRGVAKGRVESYVDGEQAISFEVTAIVVGELDIFKPKIN
jgi:3-hydroxyacyl-[acyl-carrier-protein] dehydratase